MPEIEIERGEKAMKGDRHSMEYRFARQEEEPALLDLINFVFSQTARPHDFETLIPKVYDHPGFFGLHAVAAEDGALRGTVARLPVQVRLGEATLRVGFIGSVAVHPRFRGQGHMKALMAFQERDARARGFARLARGGQRQRYEHYGFENYGTELRFYLQEGNVRHALPKEPLVTLEKVDSPDHPALGFMAALHDRQPSHCRRAPDRFYETLLSYGGQPYVIVSRRSGGYAGYLVEMDDQLLELVLTEEGYLLHVLSAWMQGRKNGQVRCPDWHRERIKALLAVAEDYSVSEAEMMKVLNWERVLNAAFQFRAANVALPDGKRVLYVENAGAWALTVQGGKAAVCPTEAAPDLTLTERQAVSLLFSPLQTLLSEDTLLKSWLPLSIDIPVADQF